MNIFVAEIGFKLIYNHVLHTPNTWIIIILIHYADRTISPVRKD